MSKRTIIVTEEVNSAGSMLTEDRLWHEGNCVAIFDGSTSLGSGEKDASWLIDCFLEGFVAKLHATDSLVDAINAGVQGLSEAYHPEGTDDIPPSAAALFLQLEDDVLNVVNLGDCRCFLSGPGVVQEIYSDVVEKLDRAVLSDAATLAAEMGESLLAALKEPPIQEQLRANRMKMNQPDGYKVIAPNTAPVTAADVETFAAPSFDCAVLITDGFDWVVDDIVAGEKQIAAILDDLRSMEQADSELVEHPRFKVSDDAAMMRVVFQPR